jgi:hypothetical protein
VSNHSSVLIHTAHVLSVWRGSTRWRLQSLHLAKVDIVVSGVGECGKNTLMKFESLVTEHMVLFVYGV